MLNSHVHRRCLSSFVRVFPSPLAKCVRTWIGRGNFPEGAALVHNSTCCSFSSNNGSHDAQTRTNTVQIAKSRCFLCVITFSPLTTGTSLFKALLCSEVVPCENVNKCLSRRQALGQIRSVRSATPSSLPVPKAPMYCMHGMINTPL